MRKFLFLFLPLFTIFTIGASVYLLKAITVESSTLRSSTVSSSNNRSNTTTYPRTSPPHRTFVSVTPTLKATITPTATPTGKLTSVPIKESTLPPRKDSLSKSASLSSVQEYILSKINEYRLSFGLGSVQSDIYTCNFAKMRVEEISRNFNHDGFRERIDNNSLPYPSYREVTENIAMTSHYQDVVTMWINSPNHAENMRKDTPYVCVAAYNNYYAYEGWKP